MKFAHVYRETLKSEGFPSDWVESAISYSQLKKCINRLTNELNEVGLNPSTLSTLLKNVEDYNATNEGSANDEDRPFEYVLSEQLNTDAEDGDEKAKSKGCVKKTPFYPKLLFYVDETTGELLSAKLDENTKKKLHMLAVESGMSKLRVLEEPETAQPAAAANGVTKRRPGFRTVEIPLTSDLEFFTKLSTEVSGLEALQVNKRTEMHKQIRVLGNQVARLTNPDHRSSRKLLQIWRQIFQAYVESGIFFGSTEQDHTAHDSDKATIRFLEFTNKIATTGLVDKLKNPENLKALNTFMNINREILQGLRFGEINRMAMMKILKKFDKQTALGVKSTFPAKIEYPEFSEHLAKVVCAEVNTQILSHVPQIDDYSCPMCMDLKWRPVKLRCRHTFCIRCLIVMQNNKQNKCPLCRENTVVEANSDNLDIELAEYLKKWFPDEVKAKQKYNERMAAVDEYGEIYDGKCIIM